MTRFDEPDDATPLTLDERRGLKQSWITHRRDLNEAEQVNILAGRAWAKRVRHRTALDVVDEAFMRSLHRRMFGDVWEWAGRIRQSERNIGVPAYRIATDLAALLDDARFWIEHGTFEVDELAIRFHHRLVAIHPFPNGNGRHARLMADLLVERLDRPAFSWGGGRLTDTGLLRAAYIRALRAADRHDIAELLMFARS